MGKKIFTPDQFADIVEQELQAAGLPCTISRGGFERDGHISCFVDNPADDSTMVEICNNIFDRLGSRQAIVQYANYGKLGKAYRVNVTFADWPQQQIHEPSSDAQSYSKDRQHKRDERATRHNQQLAKTQPAVLRPSSDDDAISRALRRLRG